MKCPRCQSELKRVAIPSVYGELYHCEHCDEVYVLREQLELWRKKWNVDYAEQQSKQTECM